MPFRDHTGPWGTGPIGRGDGPCREEVHAAEGGHWYPRRRGFNRRGWPGRGFCFPTELSPEEEKRVLQRQQEWLQERMDLVKSRLEQLEQPSKTA
jgi:hypothetical protein